MKVRTTSERKSQKKFNTKNIRKGAKRFLKIVQKPDVDSRFEAAQLFSFFTAAIIKKNTEFVR